MDLLYPVSYLVSLGGLVLWFFLQDRKPLSRLMSALFLTGFLLYITSLAFSSGTLSYKLLVLVRDMVVMGIVFQIFTMSGRSKALVLGLAAAAAGIVYMSYFRTLDYTFPQLSTENMNPEGEFLIEVAEENHAVLDRLTHKFNCTVREAFHPADADATALDNYYIVDLKSTRKRDLKRIFDWMYSADGVVWAEPNEIMSLSYPESTEALVEAEAAFANDPEIRKQWGFEPLEVSALHKALSKTGLQPQKTALVVIIDTGVDAGHEDIQANYRSLKTEYDQDPAGHGTHCAGIAGAVSNNQIGIASFAPKGGFIEISSIRALSANGSGTQDRLIAAMIEAVDAGADVLSLSLGGPSTQMSQRAYREAVKYAEKHNAIVVTSAGNSNMNARRASPANVKGVIAVSAVDASLTKAKFSNTVEDIGMGVAAPGVQIYSTLPGNRYGAMNGTSMAAPYVSGLIGLLKSFQPALTAQEAYDILESTGSETKDTKHTGKLIQPYKALEAVID